MRGSARLTPVPRSLLSQADMQCTECSLSLQPPAKMGTTELRA